jgi:hypothetical protein
MRRLLWAIIILCCWLVPLPAIAMGSHSSSHSSAPKIVHVRTYTKKDGTVVHAHDRAAPGAAEPYKPGHVAEGYSLHSSVERDSHGKIRRSKAAREAFMRSHPCPANGNTHGSCHGYVVDHVKPLECGGADDPSNMQWQTSAEGKAKDATEHSCRI